MAKNTKNACTESSQDVQMPMLSTSCMYMNADTVAALLDLPSAKVARARMQEWGVPALCMGVGKGRGMRWKRGDVDKAIQSRMITPIGESEIKKKKSSKSSQEFWGLSAAEALAKFNQK